MYRLLLFLRRVYVPVIFLVLEGLALHFYSNSSVHTRARMLGVSDNIVGGIYESVSKVEYFMSLGTTNKVLEGRVQQLENELAAYRERFSEAELDSIRAFAEFPHEYITARVVRNSIGKRDNFMMIDRGRSDGVERGMAVVSLDGVMVGYVERVSERNAVCVSVLNTTFRASGLVRGTGHFGSVSWLAADPRTVRLSEVPKYAEIERGDTVVTSGYSFYFPEGIHIGTIEDFTTDEARASYDIDVRLGVDIASLRTVMLIDNPEVFERIRLEEDVLGGVPADSLGDGGAAGAGNVRTSTTGGTGR